MDFEREIEEIQTRNSRVELDKKWETSITRTVSIGVLIYIVVLIFSRFVQDNIYLSAAIPVIGFFLSTQSLGIIKKIWMKGKK